MKFSKILKKIITFFKEVKIELKKVNWPTKDQTIEYTLIVIGVSIAVAMFLGSLDFLFTNIIRFIL
ncbi:preprotein translocase subunit SecE [bacterium]|nr:preprotein translocase subunit SecE [bacterium]